MRQAKNIEKTRDKMYISIVEDEFFRIRMLLRVWVCRQLLYVKN